MKYLIILFLSLLFLATILNCSSEDDSTSAKGTGKTPYIYLSNIDSGKLQPDESIRISFSEPMNIDSILQNSQLYDSDSTIIPLSASSEDDFLFYIFPSGTNEIKENTLYSFKINKGTLSTYNIGLARDYKTTFKKIDIVSPKLIEVNPDNNTLGKSFGALTMTFSEQMNYGSIVDAVSVKNKTTGDIFTHNHGGELSTTNDYVFSFSYNSSPGQNYEYNISNVAYDFSGNRLENKAFNSYTLRSLNVVSTSDPTSMDLSYLNIDPSGAVGLYYFENNYSNHYFLYRNFLGDIATNITPSMNYSNPQIVPCGSSFVYFYVFGASMGIQWEVRDSVGSITSTNLISSTYSIPSFCVSYNETSNVFTAMTYAYSGSNIFHQINFSTNGEVYSDIETLSYVSSTANIVSNSLKMWNQSDNYYGITWLDTASSNTLYYTWVAIDGNSAWYVYEIPVTIINYAYDITYDLSSSQNTIIFLTDANNGNSLSFQGFSNDGQIVTEIAYLFTPLKNTSGDEYRAFYSPTIIYNKKMRFYNIAFQMLDSTLSGIYLDNFIF